MFYFNLMLKKSTSRRLYETAFKLRQTQQITTLRRRKFRVKGIRYIKGIGYMGYSTCRNPEISGRKLGTSSATDNKTGSLEKQVKEPPACIF
ncbi:MAG TPA: hypothetical protein DCY03_16925, partial [Planctomycetaceae bacterium]|nr:hypothetical protein [Planctomycetaceae bacterium]